MSGVSTSHAAGFSLGLQLQVYEPERCGQVLLSVEIDAAKRTFGGPVLAFSPARELSFSLNWDSDGWICGSPVSFAYAPA
jgi:hypothetical protein